MTDKVYHVLFLCTGNSARSIIGECIINRLGRSKFQDFSAGSHPKGEVHPGALYELQHNNYLTDGLRSKDWEEFAAPDARIWISSLPSATKPPPRFALCGRASR